MKSFLKIMASGCLAGSLVALGAGAWLMVFGLACNAVSARIVAIIISDMEQEEHERKANDIG